MPEFVQLQIKRQEGPERKHRWEEFRVPRYDGMNVITALQEIQKNPKTMDGKSTSAVAWEASCLEEVCGSCTMIINGRVRQACSTLISKLDQPIRLEPMTKFPVVRDLKVNRQRMFETLKRIKGWIQIDGTYDLGSGPRQAEEDQQEAYKMSTCMTCGCCLEVCPQYTLDNDFIGASAISQARLFNIHPTGKMQKEERLEALMGVGGLNECGNAQNCVKGCPKEIPLTVSIAEMGRQLTIHAIKKLFFR